MKSAYTLVEVLISLMIMGIIFGGGFLSYRDFTRRQISISAAREFKANLRLAQNEALAGKKPVGCGTLNSYGVRRLSCSTASCQYRVEANCSGPNNTYTIRTITMPPGVTISAYSPNPIFFKSVGQGTNITNGNSVTINIASQGTTFQQSVVVGSVGDIR